MSNQLVIGTGEVGLALQQVLDYCHARDVAAQPGLNEQYDVLHIAYPWQIPDFVGTTIEYQNRYEPVLVVVHSTVPVGTCDEQGWVHSPVRGKHPDLYQGLERFAKHFGGRGASIAAGLWPGTQTVVHEKAATTEAGKLFELAQYGMEIVMQKEIFAFCEENGLEFEEVYTDFGRTYNEGWCRLRLSHFSKPLLTPQPGAIGGHCVIPGAEMLGDYNFWGYVQVANEAFKEES